jgi:deoxyadenosine/deoxycytidine kinase
MVKVKYDFGYLIHFVCNRKSREKNITTKKSSLETDDEIFKDLIKLMIKPEIDSRISVKDCLCHPFF